MSIAATVENDIIKLPTGMHVPDGTRVSVVLPPEAEEVRREEPEAPRDLEDGPLGWMTKYLGCITGLPEDFAAQHDHYIHGTPKRTTP